MWERDSPSEQDGLPNLGLTRTPTALAQAQHEHHSLPSEEGGQQQCGGEQGTCREACPQAWGTCPHLSQSAFQPIQSRASRTLKGWSRWVGGELCQLGAAGLPHLFFSHKPFGWLLCLSAVPPEKGLG